AQIGYACDVSPSLPATDSAADIAAAHKSTFSSLLDRFSGAHRWRENAWWLDPVFLGRYPASALAALGKDAPEILAGDMETIHQPLDFLGANVYGGWLVRASASGEFEEVHFPAGIPSPPSAGRWRPTLYTGCPSGFTTVTACPFSSPKTAARPATGFPSTAKSTIPSASISPRAISLPSLAPRAKASRCSAIFIGRCSTISNGRKATPSASACSSSISPRAAASQRIPPSGTLP